MTNGHRKAGTDKLTWLLSDFTATTDGVKQTIAVSSDGFLLATSPGSDTDGVEQLAAVISGLTSLTQGAASLFEFDRVHQVIVEMSGGFLFVVSVSNGSTIATLAELDCDIGALGFELTLLVQLVGEVLTPDLVDTLKNALTPLSGREGGR
ncbi:MAG: roadblock/LC7 domain-containing protein [Actinomycetia bacterium]|nr:roadblock/LC7 domain-containing protein [Actinomycetes bacterium]MCP4225370.1 roadblock/LC7 domain-containing protein [Actinomycetes bacterium]MCP5034525.1 roadblock/LC7 domain-containing protein [Actinomycetes bacterium]